MTDQPLQLLPTTEIEVVTYPDFVVELFDDVNDVVYHFYPNDDGGGFPENFAQYLEDSFAEVLPKDADVRAGFTNLIQAKQLERRSGDQKITESYWVKVKDYAKRPMVNIFLKERIFEILQERIG